MVTVKKIGRPTDSVKCHHVKARVNAETFDIMGRYCEKKQITCSSLIRKAVIQYIQENEGS